MNKMRCAWLMVLVAGCLVGGCDGLGQPAVSGGGAAAASGGDEYTILLHGFPTRDHVQQAQHYKESTEQQAGWTGLFIVHKDDMSELFWGKYPTVKAAQVNLVRAKTWTTRFGVKPYDHAFVVPIPGKDIGPDQWNLAKANGAYTVLVATFYDVPEANYVGRRNIAVQCCKQFRDEGQEAYFYHGRTQSIVTLGLFPEAAIKEVKTNAGTVTEEHIQDGRINQILAKHPFLAENGRKVRVMVPNFLTKRAQMIDKPSYVIRVPRKTDNESALFDHAGNP